MRLFTGYARIHTQALYVLANAARQLGQAPIQRMMGSSLGCVVKNTTPTYALEVLGHDHE
jgi:hypothetical protein